MKNRIHYIIAFIGWCSRKLLGNTIDNIQDKHERFYRQLQREPFLTMVFWFFASIILSLLIGLVFMITTEDREIGWLVMRGFFWTSFGYMMMGHLTNALRAFEREREYIIDQLKRDHQ
jgi:hypothetical protein